MQNRSIKLTRTKKFVYVIVGETLMRFMLLLKALKGVS